MIFINEVNALGAKYKERIYREFLGGEPPIDISVPVVKMLAQAICKTGVFDELSISKNP